MRNFYLFLSGSWKLPISHELLFVWRKQLFESFHSLFAEQWKMQSKCFRQFCLIWFNFTKYMCYSKVGNWIFICLHVLFYLVEKAIVWKYFCFFCTIVMKIRKLTPTFWENSLFLSSSWKLPLFHKLFWRKRLFESFSILFCNMSQGGD